MPAYHVIAVTSLSGSLNLRFLGLPSLLASQAAGGCRRDGLILECGRLLAWSHRSANSISGMVRRARRRVAGWSRASYCFDHRPCNQEYRHSKDLNGAGLDLSKPFHGDTTVTSYRLFPVPRVEVGATQRRVRPVLLTALK